MTSTLKKSKKRVVTVGVLAMMIGAQPLTITLAEAPKETNASKQMKINNQTSEDQIIAKDTTIKSNLSEYNPLSMVKSAVKDGKDAMDSVRVGNIYNSDGELVRGTHTNLEEDRNVDVSSFKPGIYKVGFYLIGTKITAVDAYLTIIDADKPLEDGLVVNDTTIYLDELDYNPLAMVESAAIDGKDAIDSVGVANIYDANGKIVRQMKTNLEADQNVDLSSFKSGKYEVGFYLSGSKLLVKSAKLTILDHASNAPTIETKDVTIDLNQEFNPMSGLVKATDQQDGDLTDKVTVKENTVDPSKAGIYKVVYTVTDSDNHTTSATANVTVNAVYTKDIFSIEEPTWMEKAGVSKGLYHDRQDLGRIVNKGAKLFIRQTNPDYKGVLTLELLNNSGNKEKKVGVDKVWREHNIDFTSVPFILTPFGDKQAKIEYKIEGESTTLPIFNKNDNEEEFFNKWQDSQEFGLVKSEKFQLLVPEMDKAKLGHMNDFSSVDTLIDHYEDVFKEYNKLMGVSKADEGVNKLDAIRYFLKADENGDGYMYYSDSWTASTSTSVDPWLDNGWGPLHEIAHGYQGAFMDKEMMVGEVWNNIYATIYEANFKFKTTEEFEENSWLLDYGDKKNLEYGLMDDLEIRNKKFDDLGLRERLLLLSTLIEKTGYDSFTHFNQAYRKLANETPNFNADDYSIPYLLQKYLGENPKYDVTPILEQWKVDVSKDQGFENRKNNYHAVAMLKDVVPGGELDRTAYGDFTKNQKIRSKFSVVDNKTLSSLGFKGNLTFNLTDEELNNLKGATLVIKDGPTVVKSIEITQKSFTVNDLPNGVYSLTLNQSKYTPTLLNKKYCYVKNDENTVNDLFKTINLDNSALTRQKFDFRGLSDNKFADLSYILKDKEILVNVLLPNPHSYFPDTTYAKIEIYSPKDILEYENDMKGNKAKVGSDKISVETGAKVKIYHEEGDSRLLAMPADIIEKKGQEHTFIVSKYGLVPDTFKLDPQAFFINRIKNEANLIRKTPEIMNEPFHDRKIELFGAIKSLPKEECDELLKEFADIFKTN